MRNLLPVLILVIVSDLGILLPCLFSGQAQDFSVSIRTANVTNHGPAVLVKVNGDTNTFYQIQQRRFRQTNWVDRGFIQGGQELIVQTPGRGKDSYYRAYSTNAVVGK